MLRAIVVLCLLVGGLAARAARAQEHEAPPAPDEPSTVGATPRSTAVSPNPDAEATDARETAKAPEPQAQELPSPAPAPAPPARRYEGQVEGDENTPVYTEDLGRAEDPERPEDHRQARFPAFSIRVDPINLLIDGRLGFELEVAAWKFISVELVPVFVANTTPPTFNFEGRDDPISQHSHGLGPLAGASLGAGFWFSGKALEGYVLRAILTNYAFRYQAADSAGVFDRVNHTERQLVVLIGSLTRLGLFTISGGIGLGYELNQQQRCFVNVGTADLMASTHGCPDSGELHILVDRLGDRVADLNGGLHPFYLIGRISLGVTID